MELPKRKEEFLGTELLKLWKDESLKTTQELEQLLRMKDIYFVQKCLAQYTNLQKALEELGKRTLEYLEHISQRINLASEVDKLQLKSLNFRFTKPKELHLLPHLKCIL